jgi:hypothetical protein
MAKPFITEKDVILCRSGIQVYLASEVARMPFINERPASDIKSEYRVMRRKGSLSQTHYHS